MGRGRKRRQGSALAGAAKVNRASKAQPASDQSREPSRRQAAPAAVFGQQPPSSLEYL